jgi:hypothetical protein
VTAKSKTCVAGQSVVLFRVKRGADPAVGKRLRTNSAGKFALRKRLGRGRYYARVAAVTVIDAAQCDAAKSKTVARR